MYAFVHIEKTAGTTLKSILRRSFSTGHCDIRLPLAKRCDHRVGRNAVDAADLRRVRRLYRNLKGIAGHRVKVYTDLTAACPDLRFFTVLRDPAARYRSHFLNRYRDHSRQGFDAWLANTGQHNWQTRMIAGEPDAQKAIRLLETQFGFVGLTERFDESLVMFAQWLEEPTLSTEYHRKNQLSDKRRPQDRARERMDMSYLDSDEYRAHIRAANSEDQKVYDFVLANIYPRQIAAYRGDLEADVRALQERNRAAGRMSEPVWGSVMRNYIYKPLLHCYLL